MVGWRQSFKRQWHRVAPKGVSLRISRGLIAVALTLVVVWLPLEYLESYLYDLRVRLQPSPPVSELLELVFVNSNDVQTVHGIPSLQDHIVFLNQLKAERPRAVVYLIDPKLIVGTETDRRNFVSTATSLPGFYYVTDEMALRGEVGKLDLPGVLKPLKVLSGPITSDSKILAQDGVTRRVMLTYQGNILFHPYLASQIIPERALPAKIRGRFDFYDSEQAYVDMAPTGAFPRNGFSDIMASRFKKGRYKNKVILVGTDLGQSTKEYIKTPHSRQVTAMTVVEAHANFLNSLIRNAGVATIPFWLNFIVLFSFVILSVEVVLTIKPIRGLMVLGMTLLIFFLGAFVVFWPFGYWVEMAKPLVGLFISYYFLIPYRLIVENRRSWELYQKNKLLTQVEELKTNFIGMMSHDLKTPLARIQGMVEIVLRDKSPLSEDQKHAVKSIQQSTEDLLKFITSILSFSRLESQGIQLNIKSKDINAIIDDVVSKTEFLAREKKIKIVKNLEPLFSIRIDPDLIRQAISNLVENAIKYSLEGTQITIRTEERGDKVIVHVADQGLGIPEDELPRLFMKFFRSRITKNSIKGTGLGLYLSKYFIELHKGRILVTSIEKKGSTFTIELPVNE